MQDKQTTQHLKHSLLKISPIFSPSFFSCSLSRHFVAMGDEKGGRSPAKQKEQKLQFELFCLTRTLTALNWGNSFFCNKLYNRSILAEAIVRCSTLYSCSVAMLSLVAL